MATHLFYTITNSLKQTNMKCVQFHLYLMFVFQFLHLILMVTLPYSNLFVFLLYHGTEKSPLLLIKFVLQIATFFFSFKLQHTGFPIFYLPLYSFVNSLCQHVTPLFRDQLSLPRSVFGVQFFNHWSRSHMETSLAL